MFYCFLRCNCELEISKVKDNRKKLADVARESIAFTQLHALQASLGQAEGESNSE